MLLQIMEEGRLTDSFGRHVDFRNTILIMTSNIGAKQIKDQTSLGFRKTSEDYTYEKMKDELMKEVDRHFRPEFLNRLSEVLVFHYLTKENLKEIIDIELGGVRRRLTEKGLDLQLTDAAKEFIIDQGANLEFGARPLRRALEQLVEDPLSEEILKGAYEEKNVISVRLKDDHLYFHAMKKKDRPTAEEEAEEPVEA
jgi:ATP-dependent Clp protease ATP-binding subunit ClpC